MPILIFFNFNSFSNKQMQQNKPEIPQLIKQSKIIQS